MAWRLSTLAQYRENLCIEIGPDPKSRNVYQFIEHWLGKIDESSPFRTGNDAQEPGDCQARGGSSPTPTPFIHEQKVCSTFDCEHDCLSLARVQILAKLLHALPVVWSRDYQPRLSGKVDCRRQIALGGRKFLRYGGRNEHLVIEQGQE